MCNTKHGYTMAEFNPPYKTGFVGNVKTTKKKSADVVEYAFEWHDDNPDDEDRSCYGVSVLEGKIIIGGYPIIGISTRVDEFDPSVQWVAMEGFAKIKTSLLMGASGYIDKEGLLRAKKKPPRVNGSRVAIVIETIKEPEMVKNIFQMKKCQTVGVSKVLLW